MFVPDRFVSTMKEHSKSKFYSYEVAIAGLLLTQLYGLCRADFSTLQTYHKDVATPGICAMGGAEKAPCLVKFNTGVVKGLCGDNITVFDDKDKLVTYNYTSVTPTCNGDTCHIEVATSNAQFHAGLDCKQKDPQHAACTCITYVAENPRNTLAPTGVPQGTQHA